MKTQKSEKDKTKSSRPYSHQIHIRLTQAQWAIITKEAHAKSLSRGKYVSTNAIIRDIIDKSQKS